MKRTLLPITAAALGAALTQTAAAQTMTEVRISTSGTDEEYIEIDGSASASTDGLMIASVEGDPMGSSGGVGTLDYIVDLSGNNFGSDGILVFGSVQAAANLTFGAEIDIAPADNLFENSSQTIYLLSVPDINDRTTILGLEDTDITMPVGSTTTIFSMTAGVTILDAVAIWDGDAGDTFLDNAPVFGPDGPFLPSGIYRPGGCPNDWCSDEFLNFGVDGVTDMGYADPSPGMVNAASAAGCATIASVGTCGGGTGIGTPTSCMTNNNSTGGPGVCSATGSINVADNDVTVTASNMPASQFGFFIVSNVQGFAPNIGTNGSGNLCLGGGIGRYNGPGQILNGGAAGEFSLSLDLTQIPRPSSLEGAAPGDTWYWQAWYRDINGMGASSNLTNALGITFQ